jgi:hypothetical protein
MRAKLGIYKLNPLKLAELADLVHTGMSANAATFPNPNPSMPELAGLVTTLREKHAAKVAAKTALRVAVLEERDAVTGLRGGLIRTQAYVDNISAGEPHIIMLANMGVRSGPSPISAMPRVLKLRTRPSDFEGAVEAMWAPVPGAKAYLIEVLTGDVTVEANWRHADIATKASKRVGNLPSGKVFIRVCAKGTDEKPGAWSDPAEEVVR